ncbi:MAG: metallophosphoesterase [Spirochaetales bacterium]|nr:metallophosphoesterase [Spirochaetales bacterium]
MKRILALSDIHGNISNVKKIICQEEDLWMILLCGDISRCGDPSEAEQVLDICTQYSNTIILRGVPGNMDSAAVLDVLELQRISLHGRGEMFESIGVCGVGGSNPTPMHTPFELLEEDLGSVLERGYKQITAAEHKIIVSHAPPRGTTLDRIKIGAHVGSEAVRTFLQTNECSLCLCGHIHESPGEQTVQGVMTVNIGAVLQGAYCIIEFNNNTFSVNRRHV